MISTAKNELLSIPTIFILKYWVCSVSAYVVEGVNFILLVFDQEEVESSHLKTDKVASLGQTSTMGHEQPVLGEDRSALKLVESWLSIP